MVKKRKKGNKINQLNISDAIYKRGLGCHGNQQILKMMERTEHQVAMINDTRSGRFLVVLVFN